MPADIPVAELLKAIAIFLKFAYPDGELGRAPPDGYANLAPTTSLDELLKLPYVEEVSGSMVKGVARTMGWSFRLGSGFYPYMKLVAKTTDEPPGWMLSIDCHDSINGKVKLTPERKETLRVLKERNRKLAREIVQAWEDAGLPTNRSIILASVNRKEHEPVGELSY